MPLSRFARYAWGVLAVNLMVILWGAYVRATGSGAGCGNNWPLCDGEVIPRSPQMETLIEFTHRVSSGLALLMVVGLLIWARRAYPRGHRVRKAAAWSMALMITEALIGAGLVLFELVAENASIARALAMAAHLVNTFLLLAALTMTAWWASGGAPIRLTGQRGASGALLLGMAGVLVLGMSGAVTALGDTLFPARSLAEGFRQDLSPTAHLLIRLRVFHPLIAVLVGVYLILMAGWVGWRSRTRAVRWLARALVTLFLIQLGAGVINLLLLAPVWMQLVHLFLADLIWITLVLLTAARLAQPASAADRSPSPEPVGYVGETTGSEGRAVA